MQRTPQPTYTEVVPGIFTINGATLLIDTQTGIVNIKLPDDCQHILNRLCASPGFTGDASDQPVILNAVAIFAKVEG